MSSKHENPFRIHGVVTDQYFTDRAAELTRIQHTLREAGSKLLVYGPRRMGKTSAIVRAIARHEEAGGVACLADISTASSVIDIANRILDAAGRMLGARWKDAIHDFVQRFGVSLKLTAEPVTGLILPSLDLSLRSAAIAEQRDTLAKTLDSIEELAKERGTPTGIVLDEFQEIRRFGGDDAEWHLRGTIQHHHNVSYVLAGSQAHIIERMLGKGRAFYGLVDQLPFGPIGADHLAAWIDDRLSHAGVKATGVGAAVVAGAGPRTRDVVQVARQCFDNRRTSGAARPEDVAAALDDVVTEQEALLLATWNTLTPPKQNVLRAVAADQEGLTTRASIDRFSLVSSGAATNAAAALVEEAHLLKSESNTGYAFDSPFFRRWVERQTMLDLGAAASAKSP